MMYVDLDTMNVCTRQFLTGKKAPGLVVKAANVPLTAEDLERLGAAELSETGAGDVPTDKAEFVGGVYQRVFRKKTTAEVLAEAKQARDAGKFAPLTVGVNTFDMDAQSQANIRAAIDSWHVIQPAAVAAGWPDDGTIPWTLADNTEAPVTYDGLKAVRDAAAARGLALHLEYNAVKAGV